MKNAFFVLFVLSFLIVPSLAVLTDYQSGFEAGLKSGFALGQSYQQSNDGKISVLWIHLIILIIIILSFFDILSIFDRKAPIGI